MNEPSMGAMPLVVVGLNHRVAPVHVRERLAFGPDHTPAALRELAGDRGVIKEAVLLSTCNRVEMYVSASEPAQAQLQVERFLSARAGLSPAQLQQAVSASYGEGAALHLLRVASGLESLVLGENEILGQVRNASEIAQRAGTSGPVLSALFRYAIQAGKRARAETGAGRGDISVASIVVELAGNALGPLDDRTALLIGAGKISALTARALVKAGLRCILVANRTFERAEKLAKSLNGKAVRFQALDESLAQADIVICSTGAPHLVLHAETVRRAQRARGQRPLFIADLAVPRDADPEIASIDGVRLSNIDDLEIIVKTGHPVSAPVYRAVEDILHQELKEFSSWCNARRGASTIQALHMEAEAIFRSEVEQTLRRMGPLTPHQEQLVQALGKAIAGKLLHKPTMCLRELPAEADSAAYVKMVEKLYQLS